MFQVKMSKMDFLKDSIEISSGYSDSSEVGDLNIGCDFESLQVYWFEPEKQNQTNSFQCGDSPDKVEGKTNLSLYKIVLETLGGVNVGNVMQRPEKLIALAAKIWSHQMN